MNPFALDAAGHFECVQGGAVEKGGGRVQRLKIHAGVGKDHV